MISDRPNKLFASMQKLLPAGIIAVILAFMAMNAGGAASDELSELNELRQTYSELQTEVTRFQNILDNHAQHSSQDVEFARASIGQLRAALEQIRKEIESKDASAADAPRLKAKPGEQVTATDRNTAVDVSKPAGSPCNSYPKFTRPDTSAYKLPPFNEQSGTKRNLARQLLAAEKALIEHSVNCRPNWTSTTALDWISTREALVEKLLRLEKEYAMAFTSGYSKEEDKLIGEAYQNSPKLRNLARQDQILYSKYLEAKNLADEAIKRFKLVPDAPTRLSLLDLQHREKTALKAWRKVANEWTSLKGPEVELLKKAQTARAERGVREMRSNHTGVDFEFHRPNQFMKTDSALLRRLLGKTGIDILTDEGGRRFKAAGKRS